MKKKLLLFVSTLIFSVINLGGCNPNDETPPSYDTNANVNVDSLDGTKKYELNFSLHEDMLKNDSSIFSKDLAKFAYAVTMANQNKEAMQEFYADCGFDNIYLNDAYDNEPTSTSIGFAFAHQKINQKDFIFVSIRGLDYAKEWIDNFNIGLEGEHLGFSLRANTINESLKSYVSLAGYLKESTALFISGYSRGGGVANLLASKINDEQIIAKKENIYTYTFEAPKGGVLNKEYDNIFNIVSRGDFITYMAPEEYGLKRYGVDIDVYTTEIDSLMATFDENANLPAFTFDREDYEDDAALAQVIINRMVEYEGDEDIPGAQTRLEFVNNYQPSVQYALDLFFSLEESAIDKIKDAFSNLDMWGMMALLGEDGLYDFLKPIFDEEEVSYVEEELKLHSNTLIKFIQGPGTMVLALMVQNEAILRLVDMHMPIVGYVLLNNYQVQD